MKSIEKFLKGELIGRDTTALNLRNKDVFEGRIIDETKHTIVLKTSKGRKRLVKDAHSFEFALGDKRVRIEGRHFKKRPEERIKTRLNKYG